MVDDDNRRDFFYCLGWVVATAVLLPAIAAQFVMRAIEGDAASGEQ